MRSNLVDESRQEALWLSPVKSDLFELLVVLVLGFNVNEMLCVAVSRLNSILTSFSVKSTSQLVKKLYDLL